MKYLVFSISSCRFALNINEILEIMIPGVNGNMSSEKLLSQKSISYRDRQIPIINLSEFLFNIPQNRFDDFRVILCEINGEALGLIVDTAEEIADLSQENILSPEKCPPEIKTDFIKGKFVDEDIETFIVTPAKILSAVRAV